MTSHIIQTPVTTFLFIGSWTTKPSHIACSMQWKGYDFKVVCSYKGLVCGWLCELKTLFCLCLEETRCGNLEEPSESLPSLEVAISTIPHSFPTSCRVLVDALDYHSLTRTSSSSSLPCLSFEESWFLTPPPCFTSEGPVHMETSPLENLLIEHPSMSVYQHSSSSSHCFLPHPRHRSSSTGTAPPSPASSEDSESPTSLAEAEHSMDRTPTTVQVSARPRQAVYSLQQQQEKQCLQIRSAQKVRLLTPTDLMRGKRKAKCLKDYGHVLFYFQKWGSYKIGFKYTCI